MIQQSLSVCSRKVGDTGSLVIWLLAGVNANCPLFRNRLVLVSHHTSPGQLARLVKRQCKDSLKLNLMQKIHYRFLLPSPQAGLLTAAVPLKLVDFTPKRLLLTVPQGTFSYTARPYLHSYTYTFDQIWIKCGNLPNLNPIKFLCWIYLCLCFNNCK